MPDRSNDRAHVVILTAGALPGAPAPEPLAHHLAGVQTATHHLLDQLAALGLDDSPAKRAAAGGCLAPFMAALWKLGYGEAAKAHRVVATWVVPGDRAAADRFARFVTREIDPAYVATALDPADELLRQWEADQAAKAVAGP